MNWCHCHVNVRLFLKENSTVFARKGQKDISEGQDQANIEKKTNTPANIENYNKVINFINRHWLSYKYSFYPFEDKSLIQNIQLRYHLCFT